MHTDRCCGQHVPVPGFFTVWAHAPFGWIPDVGDSVKGTAESVAPNRAVPSKDVAFMIVPMMNVEHLQRRSKGMIVPGLSERKSCA